jgi:hypothetical protein
MMMSVATANKRKTAVSGQTNCSPSFVDELKVIKLHIGTEHPSAQFESQLLLCLRNYLRSREVTRPFDLAGMSVEEICEFVLSKC